MIVRAFEYFVSSITLYSRLRDDFELGSIYLLAKLTSKVGNLEDNELLESYFEQCTDSRQRIVVVIINEISPFQYRIFNTSKYCTYWKVLVVVLQQL